MSMPMFVDGAARTLYAGVVRKDNKKPYFALKGQNKIARGKR